MSFAASSGSRRKQGRLGALFCALFGLSLLSTVSGLVGLSGHNVVVAVVVGAPMLAAAPVLAVLPWERLPRWTLLVTPALGTAAVAALGAMSAVDGQSFLAVLTVSSIFIGLTQRPGVIWAALPALCGAWWMAFPAHPVEVLVRLPRAAVVWVLVAEVIARATQRAGQEVTALTRSTLTDPLTELGNRRRLNQDLRGLTAGGLVVFVDLDNFKAFNDRYGHSAGDTVLEQFGAALRRTLRAGDVVARFGGEEFVILLPVGANGQDVFGRLRAAWLASGGPVTFSAGVAKRLATESPMDTMRRADRALYRAKAGGRDQYVIDDPAADGVSAAAPSTRPSLDDANFAVHDALEKIRGARRGQPVHPVGPLPYAPSDR